MKFKLFIVLGLIVSPYLSAQSNTNLKLWYDKPAEKWTEALPLGNGRLGAMVFGGPYHEQIQLNENTVWAGQPNRNDNPDAKEALPEVQRLIFEGKYDDAQNLVNEKIISKTSHGMPYQTVGNINLTFPGHERFSNYYRELNIENAVATVLYNVDDISFKREIFVSIPDQVIVMQLTANKPASLSFVISLDRPSDVNISTKNNNEIVLSGITGDCDGVKGNVKFQALAKILPEGGSISSTSNAIFINNANSATVYISIASGFKRYDDISGNPGELSNSYIQKVITKPYDQVLNDHIASYQKYFNRVSIDLGLTDSVKNSTDVRIKQFAKGNDPQLVELYFQYGRYLLISSSQPGGQASNLQGLWNDQLFPPWDSKYTININTEMNYWPSEVTNLSEMNEPLIRMTKELSETGRETAKTMYGADGWVAHHNTDIWRITGPIDGSYWGMWPMGGAWLCQHLWEKYEYNGDKDYLKSVYPIMKEAVQFYISFLIEEPLNKWLVVSPSISPENSPADHPKSSISAGTTMDNQLLYDLFTRTIRVAEILDTDKNLISKMKETLKRLPPMQIGKNSQLQEWMFDWDNPEDHHRHVSHLYGVFPGNQVTPNRTPELFEAAMNSLIYRGDPSTGWSMNWKINLWARFLDGNHAYKLIKDQISLVDRPDNREKGGTYPNMFDAHPPFQIDGNFGFTSGISELLMQSHDGAIHLIPALPEIWKNGSIKGIRARGGFIIELMEWKNNQIVKLKIKSLLGGNCRIRSYNELKFDNNHDLKIAKGKNSNRFYEYDEIKKPLISAKAQLNKLKLKSVYEYDLSTLAGETYILSGK